MNQARFSEYATPDARGYFGQYGGTFVPETLISPLNQLAEDYRIAKKDPQFETELRSLLKDFVGRPSPLYFASGLSSCLGGARIFFKREDLLHTGAHKINNAVAQVLLAKRSGKQRVIAETGAGQHGVAVASAAAKFGMECRIYMGQTDMLRQKINVTKIKILGAEVFPVEAGQATLKEAVNEAMRDWVTNVRTTHYALGTAYGPHPYPMMVRDFHRITGEEARAQIIDQTGLLPKLLVACVGGGSNALGLFYAFIPDASVSMVGVEAGGRGIRRGQHASRFQGGRLGVLQGSKTFLLADDNGQIEPTHSVSAGLDYAAVGPEHSLLRDTGRVNYEFATDNEALDAFSMTSRIEGIIPALESAHALAYAIKKAPSMSSDEIVLVNLSGRGDKDVDQVKSLLTLT